MGAVGRAGLISRPFSAPLWATLAPPNTWAKDPYSAVWTVSPHLPEAPRLCWLTPIFWGLERRDFEFPVTGGLPGSALEAQHPGSAEGLPGLPM